jgi:hypothetical protein
VLTSQEGGGNEELNSKAFVSLFISSLFSKELNSKSFVSLFIRSLFSKELQREKAIQAVPVNSINMIEKITEGFREDI